MLSRNVASISPRPKVTLEGNSFRVSLACEVVNKSLRATETRLNADRVINQWTFTSYSRFTLYEIS